LAAACAEESKTRYSREGIHTWIVSFLDSTSCCAPGSTASEATSNARLYTQEESEEGRQDQKQAVHRAVQLSSASDWAGMGLGLPRPSRTPMIAVISRLIRT